MVEKKDILKKEDFLGLESSETLDVKSKIYMLEFKDKYIVVRRTGKCDYKKCGSACCRFICMQGHAYWDGFGKKNEFGSIIINVKCKNLKKDGSCSLFKTKKFPGACKQFPHPGDRLYQHIAEKCSFKFEVLYRINKIGDRIRKEMIENFKEQW